MNKTCINIASIMLCGFITSCSNRYEGEQKTTLLSNLVSITDNEDKGVKEVLQYYNGYCKYAKGKKNGKTYFELELSKSEKIEEYAQKVEMPASNIAYLFFRNLKNETKNYDEIHTILVFSDGDRMNFTYTLDTLNIVKTKYEVLQQAVSLIAKEDFNSLKNLFDPNKLSVAAQNELCANLQKYQPTLGEVKDIVPYGFKIYQINGDIKVIHLSGIVIRTKQNNEISIDLSPDNADNKIWKLNYKL